jgi:hypothetical protein
MSSVAMNSRNEHSLSLITSIPQDRFWDLSSFLASYGSHFQELGRGEILLSREDNFEYRQNSFTPGPVDRLGNLLHSKELPVQESLVVDNKVRTDPIDLRECGSDGEWELQMLRTQHDRQMGQLEREKQLIIDELAGKTKEIRGLQAKQVSINDSRNSEDKKPQSPPGTTQSTARRELEKTLPVPLPDQLVFAAHPFIDGFTKLTHSLDSEIKDEKLSKMLNEALAAINESFWKPVFPEELRDRFSSHNTIKRESDRSSQGNLTSVAQRLSAMLHTLEGKGGGEATGGSLAEPVDILLGKLEIAVARMADDTLGFKALRKVHEELIAEVDKNIDKTRSLKDLTAKLLAIGHSALCPGDGRMSRSASARHQSVENGKSSLKNSQLQYSLRKRPSDSLKSLREDTCCSPLAGKTRQLDREISGTRHNLIKLEMSLRSLERKGKESSAIALQESPEDPMTPRKTVKVEKHLKNILKNEVALRESFEKRLLDEQIRVKRLEGELQEALVRLRDALERQRRSRVPSLQSDDSMQMLTGSDEKRGRTSESLLIRLSRQALDPFREAGSLSDRDRQGNGESRNEHNLLAEIKEMSQLIDDLDRKKGNGSLSPEDLEVVRSIQVLSDSNDGLENLERHYLFKEKAAVLNLQKARIEALEKSLATTQSALAKSEAELTDSRIVLQKMKIENRMVSALKAESSSLKHKVHSLEERLREAKKQGEALEQKATGETKNESSDTLNDSAFDTPSKRSGKEIRPCQATQAQALAESLVNQLRSLVKQQMKFASVYISSISCFEANHTSKMRKLREKIRSLKYRATENTDLAKELSHQQSVVAKLKRELFSAQDTRTQATTEVSMLREQNRRLMMETSKVEFLKRIETAQAKEIQGLRQSLYSSKDQLKTIESELTKLQGVVRDCNSERNILLDEILAMSRVPSSFTLEEVSRSGWGVSAEQPDGDPRRSGHSPRPPT